MRTKYTGLQISIHWLVFLLVIMAYCAMEFRGWFPRSDRPLINMIHVSCGISILVLMVARLLIRLKFPAPPIQPKPKAMITGLSHLGHLVIYLLFIALPLIGMVMMYNRGNDWFAFGLTMPHAAEGNLTGGYAKSVARDAGESGIFRDWFARLCRADASLFLERQHAAADDAKKASVTDNALRTRRAFFCGLLQLRALLRR